MKPYFATLLGAISVTSLQALIAQPEPGTVTWSYSIGSPITSSPALASDGTVYIGNQSGCYAITNSRFAASNSWSVPFPLYGSASLAADGTIYFCGSGTFRAVNPNGTQKWSFSLPGVNFQGTPAVGMDGTIYFVSNGRIYALTSAGTKLWDALIDNPSGTGSQVIGSDGTIYVGGFFTGTLHGLRPSGEEKWLLRLASAPAEAPGIGKNGVLYLSADSMLAISSQGVPQWTNTSRAYSPAVISEDGTIYAGTFALGVAAFDAPGDLKWTAVQYPHYGASPRTPLVGASGSVYHCVSNTVFAISSQGSVVWSNVTSYAGGPDVTFTSPTMGSDGTLYATFGSTLYAIYTGDKPANSSWPMYQQNPRHTGRIEKPAVSKPQKRADSNFQFEIYDTLGKTNTVQASTDLTSWLSLTDIVITNLPMDYVDYSASNYPSRFYRTLQQ